MHLQFTTLLMLDAYHYLIVREQLLQLLALDKMSCNINFILMINMI